MSGEKTEVALREYCAEHLTGYKKPKFIEFKDRALKPVTDAIERNKESLTILWNFIKDFLVPILLNQLGSALGFIGKVAGGVLDVIGAVVSGIRSAVGFAIDAINTLIRAYNAIPLLPNIPTITKPTFTSPSGGGGGGVTGGGVTGGGVTGGGSSGGGGGGGVTIPVVTGVMPTFPSGLTPTGGPIPSNFDVSRVRAGEERGNVIVNVNAPSAIDEEGFTRAVILALNNSTNRGTTGAGDLRTSAQIL